MNNPHKLVAHRLLINQEIVKLVDELNLANIKFLTIKGFAVSKVYYSNEIERQFGDIDFYIDEKDLVRFISIASKLGYTNIRGWVPQAIAKQIPLRKVAHNQVIDIDLHYQLTVFDDINSHLSFAKCFEHAITFKESNRTICTFSHTDAYLFSLYHCALELKKGNTDITKWKKDLQNIYRIIEQKSEIPNLVLALQNTGFHQLLNCTDQTEVLHHMSNKPLSSRFLHQLSSRSASQLAFILFKFWHTPNRLKYRFMIETLLPPVQELNYSGKYKSRLHRLFSIKE